MKSHAKASAALGLALYWGDSEEGHRALCALACRRCGQLDCEGYPCTPWEVEAMEEAERDTTNPDADWQEVQVMLKDPGLVTFVGDIDTMGANE